MAEQAADAGAHGLLVVSPYYSRPSQEGIFQHTVAVADTTDLPVMLYDVPGRTVVRYSPETLRGRGPPAGGGRQGRHRGRQGALRVIAATGLAYYSGDDGLLLPFLAVGAVGSGQHGGPPHRRAARPGHPGVRAGDTDRPERRSLRSCPSSI